jgi:uncharacterized membrane protein YkvA (DUF1232 family)
MPVKLVLELSDADLDHFRAAIREAQTRARSLDEKDIIAAARRLAGETSKRPLPEFVRNRLRSLDGLVRMLEDEDWKLEGAHRARVVDALAYFAEPADLIHDQLPGIGFLDDAIMVELVVQELRHDLDAYADFCKFREKQRLDALSPEERRKLLDARRHAMLRRIESRRERRERRGGWLFSLH